MSDSPPTGKHILVVDDTKEVLELFRDIIEAMGHRVTAMTFAPKDLAEVIKIGPDLVILDLLIGGETGGWQLAQKMRMSHETENIPVVICTTATKELRDQENALVAQAMTIVLKPFSIDDLETAINTAWKLPELMS